MTSFPACPKCGVPAKPATFCTRCGTRQADAPPDPWVGRLVADRYEIVSPLKEGGMGRIYVANQKALDRKVALKLMQTSMLGVQGVADRFMAEARACSQLNHP